MKLIATIVATFALLLGGVAVAPAAVATDCPGGGTCPPPLPPEEECVTPPPGQGPLCPEPTPPGGGASTTTCAVTSPGFEQAAADDRAQVVELGAQVTQQTARANRAERLADRRAATIKRLRAKIRALR